MPQSTSDSRYFVVAHLLWAVASCLSSAGSCSFLLWQSPGLEFWSMDSFENNAFHQILHLITSPQRVTQKNRETLATASCSPTAGLFECSTGSDKATTVDIHNGTRHPFSATSYWPEAAMRYASRWTISRGWSTFSNPSGIDDVPLEP